MRPFDGAGTQLLPRSSPGDGERHPRSVTHPDVVRLQGRPLAPAAAARILVVCGPTGTGKSQLAARVAEHLDGEVVGCDALQVYRGLDAATAKPSREDRDLVPHWLIDCADPRRDYSAADYVRDADEAIAGILSRGHVPVVTGGTGMYLRALLKGLVAAPPRNEAIRARLRERLDRWGAPRLHRILARLDAASASRLPPRDGQRIVRALELILERGETWSARLARSGTWRLPEERYDALKFGLDLPREPLAKRLAARVDAFFAAGLPGEVERLLASGVPATANAFKGIGYREVLLARAQGTEPARLREAIVVATRRLAKRQRTWFRGEPGLIWLDASVGIDALAERIVGAWNVPRERGGVAPPC